MGERVLAGAFALWLTVGAGVLPGRASAGEPVAQPTDGRRRFLADQFQGVAAGTASLARRLEREDEAFATGEVLYSSWLALESEAVLPERPRGRGVATPRRAPAVQRAPVARRASWHDVRLPPGRACRNTSGPVWECRSTRSWGARARSLDVAADPPRSWLLRTPRHGAERRVLRRLLGQSRRRSR